MSEELRFKHVARCPVCQAVIDEIRTPTAVLHGMVAGMILGDSRTEHAFASPQCMKHLLWTKGWVLDAPVEIEK